MKLCYVDETGTDGKSPAVVMVGIIADRIHRTRSEFRSIYERLEGLPDDSRVEVDRAQKPIGSAAPLGVDQVRCVDGRQVRQSTTNDATAPLRYDPQRLTRERSLTRAMPPKDNQERWVAEAVANSIRPAPTLERCDRQGELEFDWILTGVELIIGLEIVSAEDEIHVSRVASKLKQDPAFVSEPLMPISTSVRNVCSNKADKASKSGGYWDQVVRFAARRGGGSVEMHLAITTWAQIPLFLEEPAVWEAADPALNAFSLVWIVQGKEARSRPGRAPAREV